MNAPTSVKIDSRSESAGCPAARRHIFTVRIRLITLSLESKTRQEFNEMTRLLAIHLAHFGHGSKTGPKRPNDR
jgi:hypothetical protein